MKFLKYSLLLFVVFTLASCHKDEESTTEGEVTTNPGSVVSIKSTTGDVLGYVYDEDNNAVANASVSLLKETTTTDQYGVFKFKNVELDQEGTYIKVTKSGYILGSDLVAGLKDVNHTSRVKLMRLDVTGSFTSSDGGSVNVQGGGKVVFSANSIVSADGSPYSGTVNVTAKRLATDDPSLGDLMPGGLVANDSENRTVVLGSMGMVAVELRDGSGNELNIAPGSTADITFPIAESQRSGAPDKIKLWSFDESQGRWNEEGTATKEGDVYKASVSHFSFWNCDAPFPLVNICGKVLYSDGSPASNLYILIETDLYGCGYGWTNEDGTFAGKVPKNQILTIKVLNALCNGEESIVEIEVGPFDNKTILDDIILELPVSFSFEGQVLCGSDPVTNATILYTYNDISYTLESGEDGSFNINVVDDCSDVNQITVFAIDPATGNASSTVTLTGNEGDFDLQVCNDCGFTVTIDTDPAADQCLERKIKATVDGNGTYSYAWSTGETGASTNVTSAGQYCVTVTDSSLPDCEMIKCSDEVRFSVLNGELGSGADCGPDGGLIFVYVNGGYPPYSYEWSDPSLTVQNDSIISGVNEGTYTVTVTDSESCTKEMSIDVVGGAGLTVDLDFTSQCQQGQITATVTGGIGGYTYIWSNPNQGQGQTAWVWQDGTYCVTVFDELGCSAEKCIDVVLEDFISNIIVDVTSCNEGTYTISNLSVVDVEVSLWYANENYTIVNGGSVDIDFIQYGFYQLYGYWYSPTLNCEGDEGVNFDVRHLITQDSSIKTFDFIVPSCLDCEDGTITTNNVYLDFISVNGAVAGNILVIDESYNDVSAAAAAGTLSSGTYYIVVTDDVTGCYIYSEALMI